MNVTINGKPREVPCDTTVERLLIEIGLASERIAVEYNRNILDNAELAGVTIQEGDSLEIVRFVGGG